MTTHTQVAWDAAFEAWLASLKVVKTKTTYQGAWLSFRSLCVRPAWEVETADVVGWRDDLVALGLSNGTVATYLAGVKSCYRFAVAQGVVAANPCVGVAPPKVEMFGRGKWMSLAQAQQMVEAIERETVAGRRDYAFIKLMLLTGMRSAEVRNILRGDLVELADGRVELVYKPKGALEKETAKPRVLPSAAWEALQEYLDDRGALSAAAPVFVGHHMGGRGETPLSWNAASVMVGKYSLEALGEAFNQHSLRHATAEIVWRMTKDPREVQAILGHKHLATTMIYIQHFQDERAEMGNQIEQVLKTGEIPLDKNTAALVDRIAAVLVEKVAERVVAALEGRLGQLLGVG